MWFGDPSRIASYFATWSASVSLTSMRARSNRADPDGDSHCDLHEDGLIDIFDFVAMAAVFGSTWS
jgi:hypothetical protein